MIVYAYSIFNDDVRRSFSDLREVLSNKLSSDAAIADKRRMKLNTHSTDEDVLTNFSVSSDSVWCTMWRIAPTVDVPQIPDGMFLNKKIELSDIKTKEGEPSLTRKSLSYFSLNDNYLVTNIPKKRIKSLKIYLNWLLELERGSRYYDFSHVVLEPVGVKLADISSISISENKKTIKIKDQSPQSSPFMINFAVDKLRGMFGDIPGLAKMIDQGIVNTKLLVNFAKPRKMSIDEYKELISDYTLPVCSDEDVSFLTKDKKTIKASELLAKREVTIEKLGDGNLSEPDIIQEFSKYLKYLNTL